MFINSYYEIRNHVRFFITFDVHILTCYLHIFESVIVLLHFQLRKRNTKTKKFALLLLHPPL